MGDHITNQNSEEGYAAALIACAAAAIANSVPCVAPSASSALPCCISPSKVPNKSCSNLQSASGACSHGDTTVLAPTDRKPSAVRVHLQCFRHVSAHTYLHINHMLYDSLKVCCKPALEAALFLHA
jgi:hypothetical protein